MPQQPAKNIDIVVPFYKNADLVHDVADNMISLKEELSCYIARIFFINDSPGDKMLDESLQKQTKRLQQTYSLHVLKNAQNLGFVKSANRGLYEAKKLRHHVLLLNSDVILMPGALCAMIEVLHTDPMIGFVNPRSNRATLCDFPVGMTEDMRNSPAEAWAAYQMLQGYLKTYQFVPTCVGFCLLIRNMILQEFGVFDEIYGLGYNEENDLILRSNRCGYTAALANRAYAYHQGSASFGQSVQAKQEKHNAHILNKRYPEYANAIKQYFKSETVRYENLISRAYLKRSQKQRQTLAIDCTHMTQMHNGTCRVNKDIIKSLSQNNQNYEIYLLCEPDVAKFHGFDQLLPDLKIESIYKNNVFDVYLKLGQPMLAKELFLASQKSVRTFYLILDCIALDCLYLRNYFDELDLSLGFLASYADGLFFNSHFSQKMFNHRFPKALGLPQIVCGHSLYYKDYQLNITQEHIKIPKAYNQQGKRQILVFGNHYHHKYLLPTVAALSHALSADFIWAFGLSQHPANNVAAVPSGHLTEHELEGLYSIADMVIFPSMYEGFGLPVVESLARNKIVLARDSELNRDIKQNWYGPGLLLLYETTADLLEMLQNQHQLVDMHRQQQQLFDESQKPATVLSWQQVSLNILALMEQCSCQNPDPNFICKRLLQINLYEEFFLYQHSRRSAQISTSFNQANKWRHAIAYQLNRYPKVKQVMKRLMNVGRFQI